jgi:hypothetical protein
MEPRGGSVLPNSRRLSRLWCGTRTWVCLAELCFTVLKYSQVWREVVPKLVRHKISEGNTSNPISKVTAGKEQDELRGALG